MVKLADGAKDNWSYLGTALPQGPEIINFYHACDHLKSAFYAAHGENSSRSKAQFEKYRQLLRDEEESVPALWVFRRMRSRLLPSVPRQATSSSR